MNTENRVITLRLVITTPKDRDGDHDHILLEEYVKDVPERLLETLKDSKFTLEMQEDILEDASLGCGDCQYIYLEHNIRVDNE